jgi:MoaA/NifB/PqqE/SkfB family radical SAM enzyme
MNCYLQRKRKLIRALCSNRIPGQLVIQMTDRCNACCPQCGMRVTESFARTSLDAGLIRRLIDAAAENNFQAVSFTGGEPLLYSDDLVKLIRHAGDAGIPYIRTGTNGYIFRNPRRPGFRKRVYGLAEALADTPLRNFWISLDSSFDAVHEQMRGFKGVVEGIEKALPIFHELGIYPSVNLGINRNLRGVMTRSIQYDRFGSPQHYLEAFYEGFCLGFEQFYRRVVDLGFTIANTCYPMSIDADEREMGLSAVYAASATTDVVRFTAAEKVILFKALRRAVQNWRHKIRIFSPLCAIDALINQYGGAANGPEPQGCRGGIDFFFVEAGSGSTYPCGYRGNEDLGKLWRLDVTSLSDRIGGEPCTRCDWECFRDPTEFMSPFLKAFSTPWELLKQVCLHPRSLQPWMQDLLYYRACDFFDGRRPPDYPRLAAYKALTDN